MADDLGLLPAAHGVRVSRTPDESSPSHDDQNLANVRDVRYRPQGVVHHYLLYKINIEKVLVVCTLAFCLLDNV